MEFRCSLVTSSPRNWSEGRAPCCRRETCILLTPGMAKTVESPWRLGLARLGPSNTLVTSCESFDTTVLLTLAQPGPYSTIVCSRLKGLVWPWCAATANLANSRSRPAIIFGKGTIALDYESTTISYYCDSTAPLLFASSCDFPRFRVGSSSRLSRPYLTQSPPPSSHPLTLPRTHAQTFLLPPPPLLIFSSVGGRVKQQCWQRWSRRERPTHQPGASQPIQFSLASKTVPSAAGASPVAKPKQTLALLPLPPFFRPRRLHSLHNFPIFYGV